jgi:hypothetical protein
MCQNLFLDYNVWGWVKEKVGVHEKSSLW